MNSDVLVVGAGPAGAAAAYLLARRGLHVVLLDRSHFPRPKACGEYFSPGVARTLADLNLSPVLAGAHHFSGMDIIAPGGAHYRVSYGPGEMASSLPRTVFDARLVSAAATAGADLQEGVTARVVRQENGVVNGVIGSYRGRHVTLTAPLTIVADGGRSVLARSLGAVRAPRWPRRLGLVAHFEGTLPDDFGRMVVAQAGYCGVAPLPDGVLNVAAVLPSNVLQRRRLSPTALLEAWIDAVPALRTLLGRRRRIDGVRGIVPIGARARRASDAGVLLVGDVAGFFDPFTGEGIYRALRGAMLASDIGAVALDGGGPTRSALAAYDRLRDAEFRDKEAVTRLVQAFVRFPDLLSYALPRLTERRVGGTLARVLGDIAPARSFLNAGALWETLRP